MTMVLMTDNLPSIGYANASMILHIERALQSISKTEVRPLRGEAPSALRVEKDPHRAEITI
jgi:hypothetical protein